MVFRQIRPTLLRRPNDPKTIDNTIEIVRGFVWNSDLVVAVGSGPVNDFTHLVKATRIAKDKIESPKDLPGSLFEDARVIPQHWEIWRILISQFLLYEILPFEG